MTEFWHNYSWYGAFFAGGEWFKRFFLNFASLTRTGLTRRAEFQSRISIRWVVTGAELSWRPKCTEQALMSVLSELLLPVKDIAPSLP
jgi:hypothetical protein